MLKKHPLKTPVDKTGLLHTSADQNPPAARLPGVEVSLAWEQPRDRSSISHLCAASHKILLSYKHEKSHLALPSRFITGSSDLIWVLCYPEASGPTFPLASGFFCIFDSSWANMIFVKGTETFAKLFTGQPPWDPFLWYFSHRQSHCFYPLP